MQLGPRGAEISDEIAVKVGNAQETLELNTTGRYRSVQYNIHLLWIHLDASQRADEPQKGHGGLVENALLSCDDQPVLKQPLQHLAGVIYMFFHRLGKMSAFYKVHGQTHIQHITEDIIDQRLDNGGGTAESEGHDKVLIVATGNIEYPFPPFLMELYKMICIAKVAFGEGVGPLQQLKNQ